MAETLIAGRYRLDTMLGQTGMSEVWAATDLELGRTVALKLLAPNADTARFEREARAAASLGHPNITQVYDYGEAEGRPYMVLEYLSGGTLEQRLAREGRMSDEDTWRIAAELAAGLAHAHSRGVVHRDLKPANVLFDAEGRAKIADFGIARLAAGEGTLTEAGTVLGTAAYISPEQATGDTATAASDVYSFGVMLYRMLTGQLPFESSDAMELVALHRDAPVPPIEGVRDDAPPLLASTATAALAKNPAERPQNGTELLSALGVTAGAGLTTATASLAPDAAATQVLSVPPPAPVPAPSPPPPSPPSSRRTLVLVAAALVILAIVGGALAYALTQPDGNTTPTDTLPVLSFSTKSTPSTTTAPSTSTEATTTAPSTSTQATTTAQPTTTAPPTTAPTTTAAPPTTTAAPPPTTTAPPTTDTTPTDTTATTVTVIP